MSLQPGQRLLHYTIQRKLGQGGMGEVWLAEDSKLGRPVALKVLPRQFADDPDRRARLEREARAIAALNHPHIVTVHAVEEAGGAHFIAMELVQGKLLSELVPRGGLPTPRLLQIAVPLADALAAAHRQGVTHRDLKPDNVMMGDDGRLKVLDFGLAKLREDAAPAGGRTQAPTASITQEGKVVGTVAYMSPEQAEGKPVDSRSDVFSFGVLLYEMATGRRPFQGDSPISTLSSILRDAPEPLADINPSLPRQLGRIVKRCLAKDPERRYQSTADLRNELLELQEEVESGEWQPPQEGAVPASGPRGRLWLTLPAVALLAAIAWMVWEQGGAGPETTAVPSGPFSSPRMRRLTTGGDVRAAALSPDGRLAAYVQREAGRASLRVRQVATGDEVPLISDYEGSLFAPVFSPDGNFILYSATPSSSSHASSFRISTLGGEPRLLLRRTERPMPSPDGSLLAGIDEDPDTAEQRLVIAAPDGSDLQILTRRTPPGHFDSHPAWSPDGSRVAVISHSFGEGARSRIIVVDRTTGRETSLASEPLQFMEGLAWMPDGEHFLVVGTTQSEMLGRLQIWRLPAAGGLARQVTNDLNYYSGLSLDAAGRALAAVQNEHRSAIDIGPAGGSMADFRTLVPESMARPGERILFWLPDGRLLHSLTRDGLDQLRLTDTETGEGAWLTQDDLSYAGLGSLSPPDTLLLTAEKNGALDAWRVGLEEGRPERLTQVGLAWRPLALPESQDLAFLTWSPGGIRLMRQPARGGQPAAMLDGEVFHHALAPDGTSMAVIYRNDDELRMALLDPVSGEITTTFENPDLAAPTLFENLRWRPDGSGLTWLSHAGGDTVLNGQPLDGGPPRVLMTFPGRHYQMHAWSPDGTRLALSRVARTGYVVLLEDTSGER